ncbi:hypothetical protein LTR15_007642 [Elasticomyces elasticus]|nr:hypothetical protein LTR15_007642 [Elasticomyces elasticus]
MPLLATRHIPIPNQDLISWCHSNRASYDQDKPIYIDCAEPSQTLSARQCYSLIRRLVAGLRNAGLKRGDVLVQSIIAAGASFVGTNPSYTAYELNHALKLSKAKLIIAEPELLGAIAKPAAELGIPEDRIFVFDAQNGERTKGYSHWRSLLQYGEEEWVRFEDRETCESTTAFLMMSSGTTGLPKAARLSHSNLIAQHTLVHSNPHHPETYPLSRICCLPLFHAAMAPYTHTSALRSGYPSYIMRRFDLIPYLENTEKFKITSFLMVPPMVTAIVQLAETRPDFVRKCLASLVSGGAGAAPLDPVMQGRMQGLMKEGSLFYQLWAMTETCCVASMTFWPNRVELGSVGRFLEGLDVKLVDEEGGEVDIGEGGRGEMCVRGPTIMKGYLDNPEANARDWDEEGYFHTGDVMLRDPKTELWYIVDRRKELIKVRGFQVAPAEIEGVLLSHPSVVDVAVIGVEIGGEEVPRAIVVVKPGEEISENDVKEWVAGRLAKYKWLNGGVRFVDAIPKTASGKILKRLLREEAKREGREAKL